MFLFCLVSALSRARLFICALWSPAGKGLTSWLSFVQTLQKDQASSDTGQVRKGG